MIPYYVEKIKQLFVTSTSQIGYKYCSQNHKKSFSWENSLLENHVFLVFQVDKTTESPSVQTPKIFNLLSYKHQILTFEIFTTIVGDSFSVDLLND